MQPGCGYYARWPLWNADRVTAVRLELILTLSQDDNDLHIHSDIASFIMKDWRMIVPLVRQLHHCEIADIEIKRKIWLGSLQFDGIFLHLSATSKTAHALDRFDEFGDLHCGMR